MERWNECVREGLNLSKSLRCIKFKPQSNLEKKITSAVLPKHGRDLAAMLIIDKNKYQQ